MFHRLIGREELIGDVEGRNRKKTGGSENDL